MEVKLINNDNFMDLVDLTIDMYDSIDTNINEFQAVNTLVSLINSNQDFTAIGLFDETVLVGFVSGIALSTVLFKYTGIHVVTKNTEWTQKLIEESFDIIKEKGYLSWEAEATNKNICSVLEKYGATIKCTVYRKEFD